MRVAVLGAGYAGLSLTRRLESRLPPDADLVVVDQSPEHVLRHESHRAIREPDVAEAITLDIRETLDRAELIVGEVEAVDAEAGEATLADGSAVEWEYGAVCLGSKPATYGIEGVAEHGLPMSDLDDAAAIRSAVLEAAGDGPVRAVVGGAGLTGVQVAGELTALADAEGFDIDVTVVEQLGSVAPNFPENFREAVAAALRDRAVTIHTETAVERATGEAVVVDRPLGPAGEGRLPADVFVWAGGIEGSAPLDDDRPVVRGDLRLTDRTFALGDAARVVDGDGEAVPASASAAIRQARTAAANVARLVDSTDDWEPRLDPYRFDIPGWIVSVGDGAVAQVGPQVVTGTPARALKASVGAGYLTGVAAVSQAVELLREELGGAPVDNG